MSGFPALLSFGGLDEETGRLAPVGWRNVLNESHRTTDLVWVVWKPKKSTDAVYGPARIRSMFTPAGGGDHADIALKADYFFNGPLVRAIPTLLLLVPCPSSCNMRVSIVTHDLLGACARVPSFACSQLDKHMQRRSVEAFYKRALGGRKLKDIDWVLVIGYNDPCTTIQDPSIALSTVRAHARLARASPPLASIWICQRLTSSTASVSLPHIRAHLPLACMHAACAADPAISGRHARTCRLPACMQHAQPTLRTAGGTRAPLAACLHAACAADPAISGRHARTCCRSPACVQHAQLPTLRTAGGTRAPCRLPACSMRSRPCEQRAARAHLPLACMQHVAADPGTASALSLPPPSPAALSHRPLPPPSPAALSRACIWNCRRA